MLPFPKDGISEVPSDAFNSLRLLNSPMNHGWQGVQPTHTSPCYLQLWAVTMPFLTASSASL